MQNKGPLTVFDDQLSVGGKWENVEFSFHPIPIKPSSHSNSRETSLAIPIPMRFPWDPWDSRIMHTSTSRSLGVILKFCHRCPSSIIFTTSLVFSQVHSVISSVRFLETDRPILLLILSLYSDDFLQTTTVFSRNISAVIFLASQC